MGTSNGTYARFDDRLENLSDNLKQVIGHIAAMREQAGEVKSSVISSATSVFNKTGKTIKSHPTAAISIAVGIAFAIGYGVMRLLRR